VDHSRDRLTANSNAHGTAYVIENRTSLDHPHHSNPYTIFIELSSKGDWYTMCETSIRQQKEKGV
jgi:hypothetical protein